MSSETTVDKLDACCLTEYRPLPGTPQGQIIQIGGINTYHVTGKNETSKEKTIVLLTDVFGLTKNPRITADELAEKSGFDVYVPDLFNGDPIPSSFLKDVPDTPGEKMSFGTKLGFIGKFLSIGPWLFRHRQSVTLPMVEQFFKTLRSEKGIKRIEAVGYCFGGLSTMLADAFRAEAEQILARKSEIPSKFIVTEGTVHGFAARPNPDNPRVMEGYKQANDLIVEWAKTHL